MRNKLFEVKNLKQYFSIGSKFLSSKAQSHTAAVKAVDGVSFDIYDGETLGVVGESGSGKTTLGRSMLHLYTPTSGKILYKGKDITGKNFKNEYRRKFQYIFQDPYASLNPRMTVADIIGESLDIHKLYNTREERQNKIISLLTSVGLSNEHASRYPHEFSGGQRQRIGIARALAVDPEFIICDEPVSALDVSIRAQILNMLSDIQLERKLTYLFISHDLSVVRHVCDRVAVMYLGNIVELAPSKEIFENPLHPYTKALISAIPLPDYDAARSNKRILLEGEIPSPVNPPSGCKFRTRCPYAQPICANEVPVMKDFDGHFSACHFVNNKS